MIVTGCDDNMQILLLLLVKDRFKRDVMVLIKQTVSKLSSLEIFTTAILDNLDIPIR
jgi:hypothetical protein